MFAIFVATSLLIFSFTWFRVSRETTTVETGAEQTNIAREIAAMLHEEAVINLQRSGTESKSPLFLHFLRAVSGAKTEIRLPFAGQFVAKLLPPGFDCEFSCNARVIEFTKNDAGKKKYGAEQEGHGIVALTIEVKVNNEKSRRGRPAGYRLEKHHDYIVASMICSDEYGSKLKKVFLTRRDRSFYDQTVFSGENATLIASQTPMLPPGRSPENLKVYEHFSLWKRRGMQKPDLIGMKILDIENRQINISGINHCHGHIEIEDSMHINGRGVLIADSFSINGSLRKQTENDLLVLFARNGKITVNTQEPLEAALIAINRNHNGTVESNRKMRLHGLILADRVNLNNWSNDEHLITYDAAFSMPEEAYQISFSPWVNLRSGKTR